MKPFGKIYESTFQGSMIGAGPVVFALWGYVIAHARPPGVVDINPKLVALILGAKTNEIQAAIDYLMSPDPESRTKVSDGRRLIRTGEFSYSIPTFAIYRAGPTEEDRKAANAARQRKWREKQKAQGIPPRVMTPRPPRNGSDH